MCGRFWFQVVYRAVWTVGGPENRVLLFRGFLFQPLRQKRQKLQRHYQEVSLYGMPGSHYRFSLDQKCLLRFLVYFCAAGLFPWRFSFSLSLDVYQEYAFQPFPLETCHTFCLQTFGSVRCLKRQLHRFSLILLFLYAGICSNHLHYGHHVSC